MELMWVIYFIEVVCQPMVGLGIVLFVIGIFSTVFYVVARLDEEDTTLQAFKRMPFGTVAVVCALLLLVGNFTPSRQGAYMMLGAYGVQTVAETVGKNEEIQKIGKRTLSLVEKTITKYEDELNPESKNKDSKAEDK